MHRKLALATVVLSAFGWALAFSPAEKRKLDYFDPEDRRVHAAVEATVEDGRLQLLVSALGARVEPLPGFRGRTGANLQTAFEIDQLFAGGRLKMVTLDSNGHRMPSGEISPGEPGRVPLRRLRHDGTIDYLAMSARKYLLDFAAGSPPLTAGAYQSELWARGEPRLRIDFYIDDTGGGQLLEFAELGHGESRPQNVGEQFRFVATDGAAVEKDEKPSAAPIDAAEWRAKDLDAKWALYRKSLEKNDDAGPWVELCMAYKDYEFLEMLALHEIDLFQLHGIGERLKQANAPNWIRLVAWHQGGKVARGHMGMTVDGLLIDVKSKDVVASWIRLHPSLAEGELAVVLAQLDGFEEKPKKVDVSKYSGPLDAADMFKLLQAPGELAALGDGMKAEPGVVYLEQVLRAIDALVVSGRHVEPWMSKLGKLRDHSHPRVRQAVYLAYTHVEPAMIPASCIEAVENPDEDAKVREAALLAHSYRNHFEVYADVLDVATAKDRPAWRAAVSRLGDLGDGFALAELGKIEVEAEADRTLLKASIDGIEARLESFEETNPLQIVLPALQRGGWMKAVGHRRAQEYLDWANGEAQRLVKKGGPVQLGAQLVEVAEKSYEAEQDSSEERRKLFEKMSTTVRQLSARHAGLH